jgi:hypothetical protein
VVISQAQAFLYNLKLFLLPLNIVYKMRCTSVSVNKIKVVVAPFHWSDSAICDCTPDVDTLGDDWL